MSLFVSIRCLLSSQPATQEPATQEPQLSPDKKWSATYLHCTTLTATELWIGRACLGKVSLFFSKQGAVRPFGPPHHLRFQVRSLLLLNIHSSCLDHKPPFLGCPLLPNAASPLLVPSFDEVTYQYLYYTDQRSWPGWPHGVCCEAQNSERPLAQRVAPLRPLTAAGSLNCKHGRCVSGAVWAAAPQGPGASMDGSPCRAVDACTPVRARLPRPRCLPTAPPVRINATAGQC